MVEAVYECENCLHRCTESQAMITQGICARCVDIGEFPLVEVAMDSRPSQSSALSQRLPEVMESVRVLWRRSIYGVNYLSLVAFTRFFHACASCEEGMKPGGLDIIFHGTSESNLAVIAESGIIVPDGVYLKVENGNVLGKGVYGSVNFDLANRYGETVFVCLAVAGVRLAHPWSTTEVTDAMPPACSFKSGDRIVYVHEKQVLPIAVLRSKHDARDCRNIVLETVQIMSSLFPQMKIGENNVYPLVWAEAERWRSVTEAVMTKRVDLPQATATPTLTTGV